MLPKEFFFQFWELCCGWKLQPLYVCFQQVLILQRNLVMVGLLPRIPCRGFSVSFQQGPETFRLAWGKTGRKLMQPLPRNSSFMKVYPAASSRASPWLQFISLAPVQLSWAEVEVLWQGCPKELTPPGPLCHVQHQGTETFCTSNPCTWISSGASRSCCWACPTACASLCFISVNPLLRWRPKVPS